jgi:ankyrin repeat protein
MRHGGGIPNRTRITPLAIAARIGSEPSVIALLEAGANPDLATGDHWQSTPLMEAARDGHLEVASRLILAGARVNHPDVSGGTALHWAVLAGETQYAKFLLENGADLTIRDWTGETPLELAHRINHTDLIDLLESWRGRRH